VVVEMDAVHGYSTMSSIYLYISGVSNFDGGTLILLQSCFSTSSGVFHSFKSPPIAAAIAPL
jgi:hypothetical protein